MSRITIRIEHDENQIDEISMEKPELRLDEDMWLFLKRGMVVVGFHHECVEDFFNEEG